MAQPPVTFLESKWKNSAPSFASNRLIDAATPNTDRKVVEMEDYDLHRNVSSLGRRILLSAGRKIAENVPQVRGAMLEKASFSTGHVISQYYGDDSEFKDLAENVLFEHNKIIDLRGWPFTLEMLYRNLQIALDRDGELFILLTEGKGGYPFVQVIPSHRVYSPVGQVTIEDGPYNGMRVIDGCIVNEFGTTVAYTVCTGESVQDWSTYIPISKNDLIHVFIPDYPEQLRGFSRIGRGAFDWQDISETRRLELACQKLGAHYAFMVKSETGKVDSAKQLVQARATAPDASGNATSLPLQVISGIGVYHFKANTGQGLEQVKNDRPTMNQQAFEEGVVRAAFYGLGWSVDLALNPTKVGGAPLRVVVEKINASIASDRKHAIAPTAARIDGWRVSKFIKLGTLPSVVDWWKWDHQFPSDITADKKYDSDVDVQEIRQVIQAPQDAIARRGGFSEDVQDKAIDFYCRGVKRTEEIAAKYQVKAEWKDVQWNSPNGPTQDKPETPPKRGVWQRDGDHDGITGE